MMCVMKMLEVVVVVLLFSTKKKYCLHCLVSNKRQTEDNATLHEVIHSIYHLMNVLADMVALYILTKIIQKKHAMTMTLCFMPYEEQHQKLLSRNPFSLNLSVLKT